VHGERGGAGTRDQRGKRDQPGRSGAHSAARSALSAQAAPGVSAGIHAVARGKSVFESGRTGSKRPRGPGSLSARKIATTRTVLVPRPSLRSPRGRWRTHRGPVRPLPFRKSPELISWGWQTSV